MRVPQLVSDFFDWRWAPCVGLTAGSLTFVAFALLLIPTHFGGEPRVVSGLSAFDSSGPQRAIFSSSLSRSLTEPEAAKPDDARLVRSRPQPEPHGNPAAVAPRRGFSPIIERPEPPAPPPAPPAPPAAVEPPAPAPASAAMPPPEAGAPAREVPAP